MVKNDWSLLLNMWVRVTMKMEEELAVETQQMKKKHCAYHHSDSCDSSGIRDFKIRDAMASRT